MQDDTAPKLAEREGPVRGRLSKDLHNNKSNAFSNQSRPSRKSLPLRVLGRVNIEEIG
jgi:hypothetical protein